MSEEHNFHPEWDRHKGDRDFHRAVRERFGHVENVCNPLLHIGSRGGVNTFETLIYHCFRAIMIILMTILDRVEALEKGSGVKVKERNVLPVCKPKRVEPPKPKSEVGRQTKKLPRGMIGDKCPYEMTADEYLNAHDLSKMRGRESSKRIRINAAHRSSVEEALNNGTDVNDMVLAKYPEFKNLSEKIRLTNK